MTRIVPSSWLAAVVAHHPDVIEVVTADRHPEYSPRYGHGWTNNPFLEPTARPVLPWFLFDALKGFTAGTSGQDQDWKYYPSPDLALRALARSLPRWARTARG